VLHVSKISTLLVKVIFKILENHKILQDRAEPQRLTKMAFCHPAALEGLWIPGVLLINLLTFQLSNKMGLADGLSICSKLFPPLRP